MKLPHNFEEQASKKTDDYTAPPYRIRGKDLDENFKMVKPATHSGEGEEKAYRVSEDKEKGWELIFPWWPPPEEGQSVLIVSGKRMQWVRVAPEEGTYVLGAVDGVIDWIATEDCEEA
jgi:hypothetical protein